MRLVMRHYGSCGHVKDEAVTEEAFQRWTAPRVAQTLTGDVATRNEVTTEGDALIVHVHPDRYFTCRDCIVSSLESEGLTVV